MNKNTKYYLVLKCIFITICLIIVMSLLINLFTIYTDLLPVLFLTLIIIAKAINTLSIILLIISILYLGYQISQYIQSKFYKDLSINVFEAIYHGFMDIHLVYDRIYVMSGVTDINVDMKSSMITFSKKNGIYCIKFVELFGKINNKMDNEMWAVLSKPKKEFGRKRYTKKVKFPNPVRQMNEYVEEQRKQNDREMIGYVVLNGFFKADEMSDKILAPYEISSIQ